METGKRPENEIRRKYIQIGISGNMAKDVKQEEIAGKNRQLIKPGNRNEIKLMKRM